jgi:hypothetical protein
MLLPYLVCILPMIPLIALPSAELLVVGLHLLEFG